MKKIKVIIGNNRNPNAIKYSQQNRNPANTYPENNGYNVSKTDSNISASNQKSGLDFIMMIFHVIIIMRKIIKIIV